ncbi:MAG: NAD(P)H-hydrate dehydratase [Actinomycetes bacterium]
MRPAHEVAAVRAAEAAMMRTVDAAVLMDRAAVGLARSCATLLAGVGGVYGARVALLVGSGNNGGDALVAGAALALRGAQVCALPVSDRVHERGARALIRAGGRVVRDDGEQDAVLGCADLVVDGVLGIGGRGGLRGRAAELAARANDSSALVVAVDLPSGVDADTGAAADESVWADLTVTFGTVKPGLLVTPAALQVGLLECVDIGLSPWLPDASVFELDADDVARLWPTPGPEDDKYSQGVVGIAAGSAQFPGAAVLAVAGATRARSGLVRYAGPVAAEVVRSAAQTVVVEGLPSSAGRVQAWVVGPGLGLDGDAGVRLDDTLAQPVPVVVDADGLTLLAERLAQDVDLLRRRAAATVLTPHAGELVRLAADLDPDGDRLAAARTLASRTGATVLLKGFTTVVADPEGRVLVNPTGTPWLAEGGTGDVLSGVIGALLASGLDAPVAAAAAAFVHGLAARIVADGASTTPQDIAKALPDAVRRLRAG